MVFSECSPRVRQLSASSLTFVQSRPLTLCFNSRCLATVMRAAVLGSASSRPGAVLGCASCFGSDQGSRGSFLVGKGARISQLAPTLSPERSRGSAVAFPQNFAELQHRMGRGTWVSIAAASLPGVTSCIPAEGMVPLRVRCWSSVEICGGRKAHSRSLDCARDDKVGARGACRHCLRREANTGGKPAYACPSNATRCCHSNAAHGGRPTPLARALWSEAEGCGEKSGLGWRVLLRIRSRLSRFFPRTANTHDILISRVPLQRAARFQI